jgi:hypothetical protein
MGLTQPVRETSKSAALAGHDFSIERLDKGLNGQWLSPARKARRGLSPGHSAQARAITGGSMARSIILLALLLASAAATPALAQQQQQPSFPLPPFLTPRGTPEDQRACRPDAQRLCKEVIGDDDAVLRCFQANRPKLSQACAAVLVKYGK